MPPLCAFIRRIATPAIALAALLSTTNDATSQDKAEPDAKAVLAKVKEGTPGFAEIRKRLAADPVGSRLRVDGFTVTDTGELKLSGVLLVPGADDADRDAAEKQTRARLIAIVQEVAGAKDFKDFDLADGVKAVRIERLPHLELQKAANEAGKLNPAADELRLTNARFDSGGGLVLVGEVGHNPKTREWLFATAPKILEANPAAMRADAKPAELAFALSSPDWLTDWPVSPRVLRQIMARSGNPDLARIRVDRAYLVASSARADEANPSGVNWEYVLDGIVLGTNKPDAEAIKAAFGRALAAGFWATLKEGNIDGLLNADNRVPDPGSHLQKAIAATPTLDGTRIDSRTKFGPGGELALTGMEPGLEKARKAELEQTIRSVLTTLASGSDANPGFRKLTEHGVSLDQLAPVRVAELHSGMRAWAREKQNETRLSRLYFDENGILTLLCDSPDPAAKDAALAELKRRASSLQVPIAPVAPAPPETKGGESPAAANRATQFIATQPPTSGPEPVVKPSDKPLKTSLVAALQRIVTDPENKQWDGVLIERGYFKDKDEYIVRGVVESEKQKKALTAYIESLAKEPEWQAYFQPNPPGAPDLEVIPMSKLVERARRVLPAYPTFDGMSVTGARYVLGKDSQGTTGQTLEFDARAVGRTDPNAPAELQKLIEADTKYYARRLPPGRPLRIRVLPDEGNTDEQIANISEALAAKSLAGGELAKADQWLETGKLNAPHLASIWFLSAYRNHLAGDRELVRRDLMRTIELEEPLGFDGPNQRKRRYRVAKDLQGERRSELEKLWLDYWKEHKDGIKRLTFAESK